MGVQQNLLHYLTFAGLCALVVNGNEGVRWCVISTGEESKCQAFAKAIESHGLHLTCVKKTSHAECITAIDENKADAVTLDGGDIFNAGKSPHYLQPIAGENYGPDVGTCYFAVAVARSSSSFGFDGLKGKRSCHTGMGKSTGWNLPIGALLESGTLTWEGPSVEPIQQAVSRFFKESCVPGAKDIPGLSVMTKKKLCQLCKGQGENFCIKNTHEPYYGYHGAFSCLKDNVGEVAFVKHITVKEETTDDERKNYQLLCLDGSRAAVSEFKNCHLAYVAAHAVVARNGDANDQKTRAAILALLDKAEKLFGVQGSHKDIFELFSSSKFSGSNLMFKDSTVSLFHLPEGLDYRGYLGNKYVTAVESLVQKKETKALRWCCIGESEKQKCDAWDPSKKKLQCVSSYSVENCIWKIKVGEADVMSLDGGLIYTAGKCGLVPVMSEYYSTDDTCAHPDKPKTSGKYYAVAVVRKTNHNINLLDLAGKSTCHTGVNRTAGWNVPIGRLVQMGKISKCDIVRAASNYFGPSCAPGAPLDSNLCKKCVGSGVDTVGHPDPHKCERSSSERYSGYSGAFRCMAEGAGDVAFVKHLTVPENTDGANLAPWANNLKSSDFELLCDDGTRAPITDYLKCNLALSPAHAVFSRLEMKERVHDFLLKSQKKYGHGGSQENTFSMFSSADYVGKDLLFKDSTKCLVSIETNNYKDFLGAYFDSMEGLNACAPSGLIETCEFDVCHIPKKV